MPISDVPRRPLACGSAELTVVARGEPACDVIGGQQRWYSSVLRDNPATPTRSKATPMVLYRLGSAELSLV
jgi:hypothetical protein